MKNDYVAEKISIGQYILYIIFITVLCLAIFDVKITTPETDNVKTSSMSNNKPKTELKSINSNENCKRIVTKSFYHIDRCEWVEGEICYHFYGDGISCFKSD